MAAAAPLNTPLTQETYDYWECFLTKTQQFRDSALSALEYVRQVEECHSAPTAGRGVRRQTPEEYLADQLARQRTRRAARQAELAAQARFTLAPNPATGTVTVTLADAPTGAVTLTLRDMAGHTIRQWQRTAPTAAPVSAWALDLSGVAPGVYVVAVSTATRTTTMRRLVIGATDRP